MPDNDETITLQPIPSWVKYGGAALVAVVVVIIVLFTATGDDEPATNLVDLEIKGNGRSSVPPLPKNIDVQPIGIAKELEQTSEIETEKLAEAHNSDPELSLPFASDNSETLKKLEQLQTNLSNLETSNDNRLDQQDAIIKDLQDRLMSQQAQIDQVLDRLKPKKLIRKPVNRYKPRPVIVPFSLVSVDKWGSELYAVFRYKGQLIELTIGQMIDQWTVEDVDMAMGAVTIKNQSGKSKVLSIQS